MQLYNLVLVTVLATLACSSATDGASRVARSPQFNQYGGNQASAQAYASSNNQYGNGRRFNRGPPPPPPAPPRPNFLRRPGYNQVPQSQATSISIAKTVTINRGGTGQAQSGSFAVAGSQAGK